MGFGYSVRKKAYCFDPKRHGAGSREPYTISRSKIDLYTECERCFYLDQRLGIKRPDSYPLTLNNAVDELLKREFDLLREREEPHLLMTEYGIDAIPFKHKDLDVWRDALRNGIKYLEPKTNLLIRGGIDDMWMHRNGELHIVDYKATSKKEEPTLDAKWQDAYKRQVEIYQWLFRKNNFKVSSTAYFVYANGNSEADRFDGKLEFNMTIIPYVGDDSWIEKTIKKLHGCLMDTRVPAQADDCTYCTYRDVAGKTLYALMLEQKKVSGKKAD
jgi:CRISPR/Cas system-associated exonuclease Cas4 (RecB family)